MLQSVDDIVEEFGGTNAVAKRLGVSPPAVSNWRALGVIPAEYFLIFEGLAAARRLRVDRAAFSFRSAKTASGSAN